MKRSLIIVTTIFNIAFFGLNSFAQGEANNWYFGLGAGVTFNGGTATALTNGAMSTNEGCATISDASGNLLFYTNGIQVYDASHNIMPNSGLAGGSSSSQAGIIIQDPGDVNRYYIFTTGDHATGPLDLSYSIVDMTLNGGLGDVVVGSKNILLQNPVSEKLTAVPHCNETDFWIIVHSDASASYSAYLVTAAGVNTTPVTSNPGGITTGSVGSNGCIRSNHAGTKLANALLYDDVLEIYDFDNSTGVISNAISINTDSWPYGVEFSPNDNILYLTGGNSLTNGGLPLFSYVNQIDMTAGSNAAIAASMTYLHTHDVTNNGAYLPQTPQVGPDGKMYVAINNSQYLAVIDNPDVWGAGAVFTAQGFNLGNGQSSRLGLPNFYPRYIYTPEDEFTYSDTCFGSATSFLPDATIVDSLIWDFDDPTSGTADSSTLYNPNHTFTSPGTYDVQLITYLRCNKSDTIIQQVTIEALPTAAVAANSTICVGDDGVFTLTGTPNSTVTYNIDGGPSQTIVLDALGNGTVTESSLTANATMNLSEVANPGGTPTTTSGNGLSAVGGNNPGNSTGAILPAGTTLNGTNSNLIRDTYPTSTLTLEHTVPIGTSITIAICRVTNSGSVDITDGTTTQTFNAGPNDISQYITFTTGQSTNTLTFTWNAGRVRIDGVEYSFSTPSTSCSSPLVLSETVIVDPCGLPIELTEFDLTCNGDHVEVSWTTATESNNDYFTIERSTDGVEFEVVQKINGSGTNLAPKNYTWTDTRLFTGTSYYRLSQTDYDGTTEVFQTRSVSCELEDAVLIYPNPFNERITVASAQDGELQIVDLSGKVVFTSDIKAGQNSIDGISLVSGAYTVQIRFENGHTENRKIIKL